MSLRTRSASVDSYPENYPPSEDESNDPPRSDSPVFGNRIIPICIKCRADVNEDSYYDEEAHLCYRCYFDNRVSQNQCVWDNCQSLCENRNISLIKDDQGHVAVQDERLYCAKHKRISALIKNGRCVHHGCHAKTIKGQFHNPHHTDLAEVFCRRHFKENLPKLTKITANPDKDESFIHASFLNMIEEADNAQISELTTSSASKGWDILDTVLSILVILCVLAILLLFLI